MRNHPDNIRRRELARFIEERLEGSRQPLINAGISKGRISQYFDQEQPFGEKAAMNIEDKLGLDRGTIFPSLLANSERTSLNGRVPIVGNARLGDEENYFVELEYPVGAGDGYILFQTRDLNAYALRCVGDSMRPRIQHGEYVIVEPNHPVHPGDEVVVRDNQDRVMVKVWRNTKDGMAYFESINETFRPFGILETDIRAMHYVSGVAKSARKVDM